MQQKLTPFAIAVTAAFFMTGCAGVMKSTKAADQALSQFHDQFNRGAVKEIYAGSDTSLRGALSEKEFSETIATVRGKLGKVRSTNRSGIHVKTTNGATSVVLNQNTNFETGKAMETFTFAIRGEKATLAGYNIKFKEPAAK